MREGFTVTVAPSNGKPERLVIVEDMTLGSFRDTVNIDKASSRNRFTSHVSTKYNVDVTWLDREIQELADKADAKADADASTRQDNSDVKESQSTKLVKLSEIADLFHDADSEAYARYPVGKDDVFHFEVSRVRSKPFRQWLARRFYETEKKTPNSQATQDAVQVLEGKAVYTGQEHAVHVRIAEHEGRIFIDLCNDQWQVVEVSASGWRIIRETPVRFRRAKAMLPLPTPTRDGNIFELRRFANVTDEDWPLVLAWLVSALRPGYPYPVLCISGEQGSAKSTLAKMLRLLIDPNTAPLRSEPKDPRDLMIAANNGHCVALDNLSYVYPWLSDCLCRLSTGGGFSTRTLYQDDDETIFVAMRPCILNGIEELATRSDLVDRSILINMPMIPEADRRPESELWRDFEVARPRIFSGLLDAMVAALWKVDTVHLERLPRMADFALWSVAAEEALGLREGAFLESYLGNREAANELALESSPVGKWLVQLVDEVGEWIGTASQLLADLENLADDRTKRLKAWPATARTLSGIVKRLAPNLRHIGIEVGFHRSGSGRLIMLERLDM